MFDSLALAIMFPPKGREAVFFYGLWGVAITAAAVVAIFVH
jgi:hypothetical protein